LRLEIELRRKHGFLNAAFSEHRYYAAVPLQTDDHLKLLDELESILAG
jgi:hypothetical protein